MTSFEARLSKLTKEQQVETLATLRELFRDLMEYCAISQQEISGTQACGLASSYLQTQIDSKKSLDPSTEQEDIPEPKFTLDGQ